MMPPQVPRDLNSNSLLRSRPDMRKVLARTRTARERDRTPAVNVNPFTPKNRAAGDRKRHRDSISGADGYVEGAGMPPAGVPTDTCRVLVCRRLGYRRVRGVCWDATGWGTDGHVLGTPYWGRRLGYAVG